MVGCGGWGGLWVSGVRVTSEGSRGGATRADPCCGLPLADHDRRSLRIDAAPSIGGRGRARVPTDQPATYFRGNMTWGVGETIVHIYIM